MKKYFAIVGLKNEYIERDGFAYKTYQYETEHSPIKGLLNEIERIDKEENHLVDGYSHFYQHVVYRHVNPIGQVQWVQSNEIAYIKIVEVIGDCIDVDVYKNEEVKEKLESYIVNKNRLETNKEIKDLEDRLFQLKNL